jgi:hypothetical protein
MQVRLPEAPVSRSEGRGAPPFDPRLMVRLLIYGYTTGGAVLAGDRTALRRRRPVPLAGVRCGAGLPVDRPVPQAAFLNGVGLSRSSSLAFSVRVGCFWAASSEGGVNTQRPQRSEDERC